MCKHNQHNPAFTFIQGVLVGALIMFIICATSGCALPPIRWLNIGDQPAAPSQVTAAVPATCPHPGIIWGKWSTPVNGKSTRTRACNACGWAQTQSVVAVKETK